MNDLSNIFGGQDQYLEEVIILPWESRNAATGTITLPAGLTWDMFEYVEWEQGITLNNNGYDSVTISKEQIANNPTGWSSYGSFADSTSNQYECQILANSNTTATWVGKGASNISYPIFMKGYRKRYATKNLSKIINVNDSNPIGVNQRYEIDIESELGAEYVGRDLIVETELFLSGSVYTGWAKVKLDEWYSSTYNHTGAEAFVQDNGKIAVITAGFNGTGSNNYLVHVGLSEPWGLPDGTNITSAPCRIKVWKIDQFITDLRTKATTGVGLPPFVIKKASTIAMNANDAILVDVSKSGSSSGATVHLPASPKVGDYAIIGDFNGACGILTPIVVTSNDLIHGSDEDRVITSPNATMWLTYVGDTQGWHVVTGIGEGGGSGELPYEEVDILPYTAVGTSGDISLGNYQWSDFERIELTFTGAGAVYGAYQTFVITKDKINATATGVGAINSLAYPRLFASTGSVVGYGSVYKKDDNTINIVDQGGSEGLRIQQIKGYTKYKPVLNRGVTTLWEGTAGKSDPIPLSQPVTDFDAIMFEGVAGNTFGSHTYPVSRLVKEAAGVHFFANSYDSTAYAIATKVDNQNFTGTNNGGGTVRGVYGINYA